MREFWILTKLQVSSLFGINKILHMKNKEEKKLGKRTLGSLIAMIFAMGYLSIFYSYVLANAFQMFGALASLLGVIALASSFLILMFSIFETKGVLFGFGDYDIVMSWPVDVRAVAASRVFSMYAYNFVYALLLLLPAGVIYAIMAVPPLWFYPLYLVLIFLVPALPTMIGAMLGTVLTLATAKAKKNSLVTIVVQMALVLGFMAFSMQNGAMLDDPSKLANLADLFRPMMERLYPPALWFQDALTRSSLTSLLWMLLLTAVTISLLIFLLGKHFVSINSRIKSKPRGETFVMRRQTRSTLRSALFQREVKRYFSSSLYVLNTAFGYVMMIAAGVALLVKAADVLKYLEIPEMPSLAAVMPFVLGWMVAMGATTPSSVSMEGKSLWIIKSLPVSAREWMIAKIKVTLMLSIPSSLITATLVAIGLKPDFWNVIWLYLIPLAYSFAFTTLGLWLNLRMPRLDWQSEAEAIKQGGAVMINIFAGMGAAFAPAILVGITHNPLIAPITFALLCAMSLLLWGSLVKSGEERMKKLH